MSEDEHQRAAQQKPGGMQARSPRQQRGDRRRYGRDSGHNDPLATEPQHGDDPANEGPTPIAVGWEYRNRT
jgi:hypothetical protein